MSSIESRAHAFEEDLKALRDKPSLSGNDFLPLVIKLDDLLTHLQSVSDLVSRLSRLQIVPHDVAHTVNPTSSRTRRRRIRRRRRLRRRRAPMRMPALPPPCNNWRPASPAKTTRKLP